MTSVARRVTDWVNGQLLEPLKSLSAASKLTSVSTGMWLGLFPLPGVSTFVVLFTLQLMRLRGIGFSPPQMTIALAVNFLSTPLMFLCIPMWLKLGSFIFGLEECSASFIIPAFSKSIIAAISQFTGCIAAAIVAFMLATPVVLSPVYMIHIRSLSIRTEDRVPLIYMGDLEGRNL